MLTKNKSDTQLRRECIYLSERDKRIARMVSTESGRNENNQATISHGIRVLIARDLERRKSMG